MTKACTKYGVKQYQYKTPIVINNSLYRFRDVGFLSARLHLLEKTGRAKNLAKDVQSKTSFRVQEAISGRFLKK